MSGLSSALVGHELYKLHILTVWPVTTYVYMQAVELEVLIQVLKCEACLSHILIALINLNNSITLLVILFFTPEYR